MLTPQEEQELAIARDRGDDSAREKLITSNLNLVRHIAWKYKHLVNDDPDDLIAEGNIGLMTAAKRFKAGTGAKFSTYASLWIKQGIRRYLQNHSRTIRLPVQFQGRQQDVYEVTEKLTESLGREPSTEEVAKALGLTVGQVNKCKVNAVSVLSLDASLDDEGEATFHAVIEDPHSRDAEVENRQREELEIIHTLIKSLDSRSQQIIQWRFGVNDGQVRTLEWIGERLGLTKERVRQIEAKALSRLRKLKNGKESEKFITEFVKKVKPVKIAKRGRQLGQKVGMYRQGKLVRLDVILKQGNGIRQAGRMTGIHTTTVAKRVRILRAQGFVLLCPCGKPSTHRGWCRHRFQRSPKRQAVLQALHTRQRA